MIGKEDNERLTQVKAGTPVEKPMRFELVVNLITAKQIGVTIDPNLLARATKLIR